jgi:hypothetical protein
MKPALFKKIAEHFLPSTPDFRNSGGEKLENCIHIVFTTVFVY